MSVGSQNIEPGTDLSLSLGNSNQYIQRRLNSEAGAGAGANAVSRVDVTFLVTNPLSELVWTPQKGPSLKCADCSFYDKKSSVLSGAGPSNAVATPCLTYEALKYCNEGHHEDNAISSSSLFNESGKDAGRDTPAQLPSSSQEYKTDKQLKVVEENDLFPGKPVGGINDMASADQPNEMGTVLAFEVNSRDDCEAYDTSSFKTGAPCRGDPKSSSLIGKEPSDKTKRTSFPSICPQEKLESTAKNNIQAVINQSAGGTRDVKINLQMEDEILLKDNDPVKHTCTSSTIHKYQRQGKAKALSDGDFNERMLNKNNDSHESIECCNSAGLFSRGQKRWSFEHWSIVGSKRVKRKFEESPGFSSFIKRESSFLNWISNMMKRLKSSHDESHSLTLALAQSCHRQENHAQKLLTCERTLDPWSKTIGFQSSSLRTKPRETIMLNGSIQAGERSNESKFANKACDINAMPISCYWLNDSFCNQLTQLNDMPKDSASMGGEAAISLTKRMPLGFTVSQENGNMISVDSKTSHNLATAMDNDGRSFNSSHNKCKAFNVDNIVPGLSSVVKPTKYRVDSLSSLWITRFIPNNSGSLLTLDSFAQNVVRALEPTDDTGNFPQYQSHICSSNVHNVVEIKENYAEDQPVVGDNVYADVNDCFNRDKGPSDQKCISKPNHSSLSMSVRNSEAMAPVFSMRLDTPKQITPPDGRDNASHATLTCFFCGITGYHFQDCPRITNAELHDLLENKHSFDAEEYPGWCLKCFQTGHWSVACPNSSSREQYKSKYGDSFSKKCILSETKLNMRQEGSQKLLDLKESQFQATGTHRGGSNDSKTKTDQNMNWTSYEVATYDKVRIAAVKRINASSPGQNKLKRNHIVPLCNVVSWQVSDAPKGILDAVRSLRFSRTNILKWMSSQMPISCLDGFFLRLRLGKWEEGLDGTGYHVACITGAQRNVSAGNSTHCLSVNVGGVKCLVESQYISNHDFLEDELLAWWTVISQEGGKIPSENDLRLKMEEKKMLGF